MENKPLRIQSSKELGELIKKVRNEKGLSQTQLADFSGMHRNGIAKIENGRSDPQLSSLLLLCRLLNLDITVSSRSGQ